MPALVIKDFPPELHRKLKEQAAHHHRSMTREAVALIEEALVVAGRLREVPPPYRGRFPLTQDFIDDAKNQGRP